MGTRLPTSQGYHKELLKFYIIKYHARRKLNTQNLLSCLLPHFFMFPYFLFPGLCSFWWSCNPNSTKTGALDKQSLEPLLPTPSEIASVCFSHPLPLPSTKLYLWKSQRDGPQGPGGCLGPWCHLNSGAGPGQPMHTWRPDRLRDDG